MSCMFMRVEIEYCDGCGSLGMAVEVRDRLRDACGETLDSIDVTPIDDGIFRVRANGQQVFSTDREEYDPDRVVKTVCAVAT